MIKTIFYFKISVTRSMFKPFESDGFTKVPKIEIIRIGALDSINMIKDKKIIARRQTVGFRATPRRIDSATVRHTPPVPQLIPLKSALKMPSNPPFNVRGRKSMYPSINVSPFSGRSPIIPRGTTSQMIINRIAPVASTSATVQANDVTLPNPVGVAQMGRLNYSDDSD